VVVGVTCALVGSGVNATEVINIIDNTNTHLLIYAEAVNDGIGRVFDHGLLEVKVPGSTAWGTVCDDKFWFREATIACKSLGYDGGFVRELWSPEGSKRKDYMVGDEDQPIWLDNVICSGPELSIHTCAHFSHDDPQFNCDHEEDVNLTCFHDV